MTTRTRAIHTSPRSHRARRMGLTATAALGAGALLALGAPLAASAHVGVDPSSTAEGSYTVLSFSVPHGCGASPTTKLTFTMPEGVNRVTPTVNPNWTIEKVVEELPEPLQDSHGANLVDRDAQVVYTAVTPLPDGLRDVIELSLQLPADTAGDTLVFPVLQECVEGSTDWNEVAEEGEAEPASPAPSIVVTAATGDAHGHGAADTASAGEHGGGAHGDGEPGDAGSSDAAPDTGDDPVARWLGIGGLVVGAAGVVFAAIAWRRPAKR
ncbi:YcnI family copper-binding membrane protein [Agromyces aerolatus]|uniref:YcnI family copper-binding membrane protein n=1 Tax=Agromyces sp. LY-1074 TaxID=3074080 RepID=UPI0028581438|nr:MULTISPECIES: YcnI family protein [unclassified Agromyces]MDR5699162.1 YcnI family protein [Agromyces sp. LY-1074]MDR5705457.1 YcnI family protein [Agromyces sp. LY-1358]